jgi:hypothetical protein
MKMKQPVVLEDEGENESQTNKTIDVGEFIMINIF